MTTVPRRLAVLFLLALTGVLTMLGAVIGRAAGTVALIAYVAAMVVLLLVATIAAKRWVRAQRRAAGHTCACCTGTIHDPVQVI